MNPTEVEHSIAQAIAALHGHWYGRGPSNARAYLAEDVVVVVLEETFTPAECALIEREEASGIRDIRRRFQSAMAEEFISIVTQATGRVVRTFVSDTDLDQALAVETFVLGAPLEDMSQFERRSLAHDPDQP